jgi:uncharacterized protein YbjT (DUF2867 family)
MKIAVIGGTGLIGSQVVKILNASGHAAVPHSPSTGVDLLTGQGLPEALRGADVVVNLTNSPTFDDASPAFFQTSMDNMLGAAKSAGVGHAVILSIVGAELVPGLVYYRAKVLQEDILKSGPVPYSIVRATQFFEFIGRIADSATDGGTVRLPPVFFQPEAAADVSATLADVATSPPQNSIVELGGPERFRFDELIRRFLEAHNDPRKVVADAHARYYGTELDDNSLTTDGDARVAPTRFEDWLSSRFIVA